MRLCVHCKENFAHDTWRCCFREERIHKELDYYAELHSRPEEGTVN